MDDTSQVRVAVSGITGFVGAQIAADLLARGYIVHGTLRSNTPNRIAHLTSLEVPGRLEVFEADLLHEGSFDEALVGCTYAMHVASPYLMEAADPQKEVIEPAIQGTLNFLASCIKASVSKVILTSSIGAIADRGVHGKVFDESDWNDESTAHTVPYYYSKVAAERAAWSYADEKDLNLVVINPTMIIGPSLVPRINESNLFIQQIANKKVHAIVNLELPAVDVRDVSEAHILAMENQNSRGRYLCSSGNVHMEKIADAARAAGLRPANTHLTGKLATEIIRGLLALTSKKPGLVLVRLQLGRPVYVSTDKIKEDLGIKFRDIESSLKDTIHDMMDWGHLHRG
ncbi:Tetraketide alpha-pyrone reductase 1 [Gracilariopsis chorda]|uniref:Tetraketide alpha-pyrone reductase 1 n=1 Tax=Gracilariopsis chorda TaxID=448386 RepID=A0A2V3IKP0_9FLOR|nr:Tetraketide alpha-pyrone reductase 1 [Gracilariopsis chorda]|eukprot:PXF42666.1 Tetraketide alpha-pyrone reductase 1 [Gracilariopsis chorda]